MITDLNSMQKKQFKNSCEIPNHRKKFTNTDQCNVYDVKIAFDKKIKG